MPRLILAAALAAIAIPALAQTPETAPPPDRTQQTSQPGVSHAARETGSVLRRTWDGTKWVARRTGSAIAEGWHNIEHGVRWGWNHPDHQTPPPVTQAPPPTTQTQP